MNSMGTIYATCCLLGLVLLATGTNAYPAHGGYTYKTCPQATSIVKKMVHQILGENRNIAGGLLRLHFHDCFVRGCDGSLLLNSPTNTAEKNAPPNLSLRGFAEIDQIKAALEAECPGIVSCADTLALAARDAVVEVGGESWPVALGRMDGFVSSDIEANQNLPSPLGTFDQLVQNFAAKGFTEEEMVVLSGSHTIGRSTCGFPVQSRLYNFSGVAGATDPSMDPKFAKKIKKQCPRNQFQGTVSMDPTKNTFDNRYFKAVLANKGLFQSDASLLTNPVGLKLVTRYAKPSSSFFSDFAAAMIKMSNIGFGSEGEIRRVCSAVN